MKISSKDLNGSISKSVSDSLEGIDIDAELETFKKFYWETKHTHLTWEREIITEILNKAQQESVKASLTATVSLLKDLGLIDVED
ncbi:hypothetical protein MUDAN_DOGOELCO_02531 [Lactiplantibacillus mudanjiangensis]|uniref:hypothetical protein n=1 Tax=Lactiplantibacillus mudanjiangensis TaxID=1296538 RepID=UPI001014FCDB|nr:hypothetical protein [Lactiplantibacillus mudanjiangensis]VDG33338.1 hypothetical protein MUDAN_DOGOELCO_02531 [Lactiplantibacillus mudanjiangensis]